MRKWQKVWAATAGLLVLLSLLAACGPSANNTGNGGGAKKGGSIVDIFDEEPDSLLPWNTGETFGVMAQDQIWAPLWNVDDKGNFVLDGSIAKEIPSIANGDVSADLRTFTVKLKSNLKWSDGTPETAADCVASWKLMSDPNAGDAGSFPTTDPADTFVFVSATAIDTTTAQIVFKNPMSPFLANFAGGQNTCMPASQIAGKKGADIFGASNQQNFQPTVGNGPYTIKERIAGGHITMVRNPNYFLGPDKPYLDQITDQIITDSNTILQAFQAGSGDAGWFLDTTKITDFKAIAGYTTALDSGAGYEWLLFNTHDPILSDLAVRQALNESIDPKNEIYTAVYKGAAAETCDNDAGNFAHEAVPTGGCYKFDVADAKAKLDAAGWAMGTDGYRHKNGKILELEYATTAKKARENTQAIFIQDWQKVGIKVDEKNYSNTQDWFGIPGGHLCQGTFQIGEYASSQTDPDDHAIFSSDQTCLGPKHGSNYTFYNNPAVDAAEADQLTTLDQSKRKADMHIIHQAVLNDLPGRYLFAAANLYVYNNKLHNYSPSPANGDMWNCYDQYKA
jgi:peptide/nickel transport system substrate-binding protein